MQTIIEPVSGFSAAPSAGSSPILTIPHVGRSFKGVDLRVIGEGPSSAVLDVRNVVDSIEVQVDGETVCTYWPKLWRQFTEYFNVTGDTPAVDYIHIPFKQLGLRNSEWGTRGMRNLQIKVNVVATLPSSTTFTDIQAHVEYFLEDAPRGEYIVHRVISAPTTVDGENNWTNLDFGAMQRLRRMFIMAPPVAGQLVLGGASGNISAYTAISRSRLKVGNLTVWDSKYQDLNYRNSRSPLVKIPSTQYGHLIDLDPGLDVEDWQVVAVGKNRLPVQLIVDWGNSVTATPVRIVIEGLEGERPAPKP
jgi:hypothetical protein